MTSDIADRQTNTSIANNLDEDIAAPPANVHLPPADNVHHHLHAQTSGSDSANEIVLEHYPNIPHYNDPYYWEEFSPALPAEHDGAGPSSNTDFYNDDLWGHHIESYKPEQQSKDGGPSEPKD